MFFHGLLAIIIFAFVPLAIKFTGASAVTICLFRLFVTVFFLSIFWRKKIEFKFLNPFAKESWKLWLIGLIFFVHWVTYVNAVKIGGASIGVLGLSTYGVQLIIGSRIFLNHRITRKEIFYLMISMIGVLLVVPSWDFKNNITFGLILALLSATCFALLPIAHRKSQRFNEETRIFAQFLGAMIGFAFFINTTHWDLNHNDWLTLIYLAIFGTLIAHSLWASLSSKLSASSVGLAYYAIAPISMTLSHFLLDESLSKKQILGSIIVIFAAILNLMKNRTLSFKKT